MILIINLCVLLLSFTVKEKLTADPESEIATTSLRVSLLCPVSAVCHYPSCFEVTCEPIIRATIYNFLP